MNRDDPARDPWAVLRLCQLVSPALPVGAYAYSQGLEYAVEAGWVHDEPSALTWLQGLAQYSVGSLDLPVLLRLHGAWSAADAAAAEHWNSRLIAARETRELRDEDRHLGRALARVLIALDVVQAGAWTGGASAGGTSAGGTPAYATMFALAAVHWNIGVADTLRGYLWAWCENQVLAAIKLVPLGQTAGQRLLQRLIDSIPAVAERAASLGEEFIGVRGVSQAFASAAHETQYSRLFRS